MLKMNLVLDNTHKMRLFTFFDEGVSLTIAVVPDLFNFRNFEQSILIH